MPEPAVAVRRLAAMSCPEASVGRVGKVGLKGVDKPDDLAEEGGSVDLNRTTVEPLPLRLEELFRLLKIESQACLMDILFVETWPK